MKGIIFGIAPAARIVDLTQEVEPFQIRQAGYLLAQSWRWFPAGTVHVAVVDPGVGSARRAIAARADGHIFVLPDNGLLSLIGADELLVREIRHDALMLTPVSQTFHGRDIFAPAAARFASGFPFEDGGPLIENWVRLPEAALAVLHIDRFGNVITSLLAIDHPECAVRIDASTIAHRATSYASAAHGELFLIQGSGGYLEISEREASAAARIGCRIGDPVAIL